jgi:hypothetical protein
MHAKSLCKTRCWWRVVGASVMCGALILNAGSAAEERPGGTFGLRTLSDSVPDWSSRENFVRSALSGWETAHEKALAQFRWVYLSRRVGNYVPEDGRPVLDPILFFNSYGITFCSMISAINVALWESAGFRGRVTSIYEHVVSEVYYDGAWRMFDSDFYNYFLNADGSVASAEALHKGRRRQEGEHYFFDHCPMASCRGGRIMMGPSSASLEEVARDWYASYNPRMSSSCAQAGHRFLLGLRPQESYRRHWQPIGRGLDYARPNGRGKDPGDPRGSSLWNSRGNGVWHWRPDLSDPGVLFASENMRPAEDGLRVADGSASGWAVFRVAPAHVATMLEWNAVVSGGAARFAVSVNNGQSWTPLTTREAEGAVVGRATREVAGRLDLLLKVELAQGTRLSRLHLRTVTQLNPRALPALRLGANTLVSVSDEPWETISLYPRLSGEHHREDFSASEGWESLKRPGDRQPTLRSIGKARLEMRVGAPRPLRRLRIAGTGHVQQPNADLSVEISLDEGRTWTTMARFPHGPAPHDFRIDCRTNLTATLSREARVRFAAAGAGAGLTGLFVEAGHEPAGERIPYRVVYAWQEYRSGAWMDRTHTEIVSSPYHRYRIEVGGTRPPRMQWMEIAALADGADPAAGYAGAPPVEKVRRRTPYVLRRGENLARGCTYEVSRPAGAAYPDENGRLLTDGYVGLASLWGLQKIRPDKRENPQRVGELAVWEAGVPLTVTLDLGRVRSVGGVRIGAVQPSAAVLFPQNMQVEVSQDGTNYEKAGAADWEECFFAPENDLPWEGFDSARYADLPAGGILDFKFPVVFASARSARFVRFILTPSDAAGLGLWELEVYDRIAREPWSDRLVLPSPPPSATGRF